MQQPIKRAGAELCSVSCLHIRSKPTIKVGLLFINFLNLPQTITKPGSSLTYYYTVTGEKVCKQVGAVKRYYAGGFEYDNSKNLVLIHHPEGIVEKSGSTFTYEYFLKDHLGNTRMAFRPNGSTKTITQRVVYYPFGHTAEQENSNSNQYLYNGKELQAELNWYDYGARFYDPLIGRFHTVDPKAEEFSYQTPYLYAGNSPIVFIDLMGMEKWKFEIKASGNLTAGTIGGNVEVLGTKVGFVYQSGSVIAEAEAGYNTDEGWFARINDDFKVKDGITLGTGYGVEWSKESSLKGKLFSKSSKLNLGLFSVEIKDVFKDGGEREQTTTLKTRIGAFFAFMMGGEAGAEASLSTKHDIKEYTIDEMLEKGWHVPQQAIEWNKIQKDQWKAIEEFINSTSSSNDN